MKRFINQGPAKDKKAGSDDSRPKKGGGEGSRKRKSRRSEKVKPTELPGEPLIVGRDKHNLSRSNIDEDAIKVLYRLLRHGYQAFLVGGGVRDLLIEKQPKDFDISTSAKPEEVRALFRNSRIIGRRFKINHVYFRGNKIIEVSTFRMPAESPEDPDDVTLRSDNTYGDPQTDAVRRDLTINGLFYDISTFSVIDYVGGMQDLEERVIRIIGEPEVRIQEDPVRMMRAIRHAARTGFTIDSATYNAICKLKALIRLCPSARIYDEFLKELRHGSTLASFRLMDDTGLLAYLLPVLAKTLKVNRAAVWRRLTTVLERVDKSHRAGDEIEVPLMLLSLLIGNLPELELALGEGSSVRDPQIDFWRTSPMMSEASVKGDSSEEGEEEGFSRGRRPKFLYWPKSAEGQSQRTISKNIRSTISEVFEPLGATRKEREKMERLLLNRFAMFAGCRSGNVGIEILDQDCLFESLQLLRLTSDDEESRECLQYWDEKIRGGGQVQQRSSQPQRRRRRKRRRRRNNGEGSK